jgi:hypothetical protein
VVLQKQVFFLFDQTRNNIVKKTKKGFGLFHLKKIKEFGSCVQVFPIHNPQSSPYLKK